MRSPAQSGGRSSADPSGPAALPRAWWDRDWLRAVLLVAVTLLAYAPAWFGEPVWDDDAHITRPELRSFSGLARIWVQPGATQQYYPLAFSAFWVQYKLWGDASLGYHLVNILLHSFCALLFLRILRRLEVPGAWLAAGIFALHPVHVESVAWITELKNTLSGALYLGSALAYLGFDRTRRKGLYALALGLFALGLLTKTAIAILPAGLLVVFWWKRGRLPWKRDVLPLIPFFVAGLAAGLVTVWAERKIFGAEGGEFDLSFLERCLVAGRAVWFHLGKLFWPANLAFMYRRWDINQTVWWQYLYPAAALVLVAGLWALRQRNRGPLAGLLIFAGTLFPALGFFNAYSFRYSFVNDHHQYLASLGIIALISASAASWKGRRLFSRRSTGGWLCLTLLAILGSLTWQRAGTFRNNEALWRDTLAKNPACWMAHHNWGFDLAAQGQLEAATEHYRAALRLYPDAEAHLGLGAVLDAQGKTDEALAHYLAALEAKPNSADAHNNLSSLFVKRGDVQQALRHAAEAVRLKPDHAQAHFNLGNALNLLGKTAEAAAEYSIATSLKPDYAEAHYNLGGAMFLLGRVDEAASQLAEAVRLQPANAAARSKLAFVLTRQGRTAEALTQYQEALRLQPELLEALRNLAWIRATHRDPQYRDGAEAVRLAEQAVRLTREKDAAALDTLAAACAESGDFTRAVATVDRALALAMAANQTSLRQEIEARRALYQADRPFRQ
jgi:protein O-mannosyl-transferase